MRYDANPSTSTASATHVREPQRASLALDALSPVDGRYRAATEPLRGLLSEAGLIRERIRVEAQWLLHLAAAAPQLAGRAIARMPCRHARAQLARDPAARTRREPSRPSRRASTTTSRRSSTTCASELKAAGASDATLELVHFGCTSEDINNLSYARLLAAARETCCMGTLERAHRAT